MWNREEAKKRAENLVDQMTVDEMMGQLMYNAPAIERLDVPAYNWWNEGLHGVARAGTATVFPQAIALAAAWNEELLQAVADVISTEARAKYNASVKYGDRDIYKGLTMWSPNVNIFRDPRWGRGHETYGEDSFLTSRLGVAFIKGLQGNGKYMKTAACAKHFAVHSGPEILRHSFDAKATKKDMYETYLPAFEACVKEAEVEAVMGAYNRTNGEPCCAHEVLMNEILRGEWGFKGHYVSDCWAIRDFHENHKVTNNGVESSAMALNAGCDVNCGCTYLCLKEAYRKKLIKKSAIRQAAVRLFTTRYLLGLFEETEYDNIPYTCVESKEHLVLAREAAEESIVLLKNDGILPLEKKDGMVIGVIGPNANNRSSLDGNYHGTSSRYVTALEGLQDYVGDQVRILYSQGAHLSKDRDEPLAYKYDRISEALAVAEYSDVIILCVGLDETLEGEEGDDGNAYFSGDKKDLSLPDGQQKLVEAMLNCGKPVVLCMFAGSSMELDLADEKANAILQTWYPGCQGGAALARILFGEVSPSGKLPITLYSTKNSIPDFEDYSMKGRTYKYLEEKPLYPFGYGLTYSRTEVKAVEESFDEDKNLILKVTIKNHGNTFAKDVVQVYVKNHNSIYAPLNPVLCGFIKITLDADEEKIYDIKIDSNAFSVVNEEGKKIMDSDRATIYVATSGVDERSVELTGVAPKTKDIKFF